jgi:hypothetical protein
VKRGDIVKFSRDHYEGSPGHAYVKDWIGIILEFNIGAINLDPQVSHHRNKDEIKVAWSIFGATHIMEYDELWWNKLDYEPFEVISESR